MGDNSRGGSSPLGRMRKALVKLGVCGVSTDRPGGPAHQRLRALQRANHLRLTHATLKRRLRAGEVATADAILRGSRDTHTMTVVELLLSQRGGDRRAR